MDPQPISIIDSPNTYLERLGRLFYSPNGVNFYGLLLVFIPLIILIGIFFAINHCFSNKKAIYTYSIVAITAYLVYLFALLPRFAYVI
jgi:hypothetical protein